tara:strand:- start:1 stop:141 length:141 start_codon:yes stop_codon:yes gene_type:complete
VQPASIYYSWQVDTMIYSFLENGIFPEQIDIVLVINLNMKMLVIIY